MGLALRTPRQQVEQALFNFLELEFQGRAR